MNNRASKTSAPILLLTLAALIASGGTGVAGNWPAWRGPDGIGLSREKELPLRWGTNTNVRWRVPLPDRGNSTPIVWGKKVFVTQATKDNRRALLCFDRADGKLLWERGVTPDDKEPTHATNPQCSGSPTTDGERVVAWFGSAGLYCWDLDGNELWHRDLGRQRHIWGNGSSPVLHGGVVYLNFGPGVPSFLLAVDKKTGRTCGGWMSPTRMTVRKNPVRRSNAGPVRGARRFSSLSRATSNCS